MIKKVGNQWILYSKDGSSVLGRFPSRKAAQDRERQIQYFKQKEGDNMINEEFRLLESESEMTLPITEMLVISEVTKAGVSGEGKEWEVVIIGPDGDDGLVDIEGTPYVRSRNGRFYNSKGLEESLELWDGIKVFDNHLTDEEFEAKQGMRSVANEWVGVIVKPWWDKATNSVKGILKVIDEGLRGKFKAAWEAGVLDKIGLSIDAMGSGRKSPSGQLVEKITKAMSVDVVADPAAGGRLGRMLAAQQRTAEDIMSREEIMKLLEEVLGEKFADMKEALDEMNDEKLAERLEELKEAQADAEKVAADAEAAKVVADEAAADAEAIKKEATEILEDVKKEHEELKESRKLHDCGVMLHKKLEDSGLPSPMQALITGRFEKKAYEEADLDAEIVLLQGEVERMTESGMLVLPEGARISGGKYLSGTELMELRFIRMMAGPNEFDAMIENKEKQPWLEDHVVLKEARRVEETSPKPFRLSRWYEEFAGDDYAEGFGFINGRVREANLTTAALTSIIKNTVNLFLANDYSQRERWWAQIVTEMDVDNLDDVTLVRLFGMDNLPVVAEGATYTEKDWADEEETASYIKKGYFVGVTLETFLQDKINVIRTIPRRMSNAWYNTISALVSSVFTCNSRTGPQLATTSAALFNNTALSSTGHANLLTTGLGYDAYIAARLAMMKQTDQQLGAGRRLLTEPAFVMVPIDLENTAIELRESQLVPHISGGATGASDSQTKNILRGRFNIIVVPDWTDTNDWALMARPSDIKSIYLVWHRGRRTPELISAGGEKDAAYFTNDTIRYKVRQFCYQFSSTYTCAPVADWRGFHKSNV